jgi:hypothetical protein
MKCEFCDETLTKMCLECEDRGCTRSDCDRCMPHEPKESNDQTKYYCPSHQGAHWTQHHNN